MTGSYIQNKKAIYKYLDANREKVTTYIKNWRLEHKDSVTANNKRHYTLKRDCDYEVVARQFRRILL